jgi:hypothetical protein
MWNSGVRAVALLLMGMSAGCGSGLVGSYAGDAVESGSITLSVPQTEKKAINQKPATKRPSEIVTVVPDRDHMLVKFGPCELPAKLSGGQSAVVAGDCELKFAGFEGPLPLSGLLHLDSDAMRLEVTGTATNATTVVAYQYSFEGKRK